MQERLHPGEDGAIVADSGEDDVCSVTLTAFEVAAAEVTVGLYVADHGFEYDGHAKCRARHRPTRERATNRAGGARQAAPAHRWATRRDLVGPGGWLLR